jgi:hypothetical protein
MAIRITDTRTGIGKNGNRKSEEGAWSIARGMKGENVG